MNDTAARIAAIVCQELDAGPAELARVEHALRRELGGQQVRIAERPPITLEAINEGLRQRKSVRVIAAEAGVDRSTIYRHLGRRPKKSQRAPDARQP